MMAHGLRCTGWRPRRFTWRIYASPKPNSLPCFRCLMRRPARRRGAECTGRLVRKQRPADGERVVIRVQPIDPVTFERQRREALFRSLDNDTDGRISISEAKVNHQFVDASRAWTAMATAASTGRSSSACSSRTMPNPRVLRVRKFFELPALSAVEKTPAGLAPAGVGSHRANAMEEDEDSPRPATNDALTQS